MIRRLPQVCLALLGLSAVAAFAAPPSDLHYTFKLRPRRVGEDGKAPPSTAITPSQMRSIYGFSSLANQGQGQTIALVLWNDDPNIESDLGVFTTEYGLPACTTANGCFTKIYASGTKPVKNADASVEMSLDVEWSHAIAPQAKIILVEAANSSTKNILIAIKAAVSNGATVVSMSFGASESSADLGYDTTFNVPGVTFVASSGDGGHGVSWPASSPYVIGVGGTTLTHSGGTYESETAWSGSGGGVSAYESEPSYQTPFQNQGKRGVPDLAYDADPNSGVAIYDSTYYPGFGVGWSQVGGTSMGSPEIAALIAIINSSRVAAGKGTLSFPADVYSFTADYHDITSGTNGSCGTLCTAAGGYDFVTGVGTPIVNVLVPGLVSLP